MPVEISNNIILPGIVPELFDEPKLFIKLFKKLALAIPKTTKTKTIVDIRIKKTFNVIPSKLDWKLEPNQDLSLYLSALIFKASNMPLWGLSKI